MKLSDQPQNYKVRYRKNIYSMAQIPESTKENIRPAVETQARFHTAAMQTMNSQNFVPFLTKSNRFQAKSVKNLNPPIGSYNLPSCFDRKQSYLQQKISSIWAQNQKKQQEMSIFKSSHNRFQRKIKDVPGPAEYNLFKTQAEKIIPKARKVFYRQYNDHEMSRSCPSIPNKNNRYGYAVNNGKIKTITKNDIMLQKQRISRKEYLQTLQGQKQMIRDQHYIHQDGDYKKKLYDQTKKVIRYETNYRGSNQKIASLIKKPRFHHLYNSKGNISHEENTLGPGSYNVRSSTLQHDRKKMEHQFFDSTEVRFKEQKNKVQKGYSLIQMIKEQRKVEQKFKKEKNVVKSHQTQVKDKVQLPGPGDYDPSHELLMKSRGKAFFPVSQRFQGMYQKPEEIYFKESQLQNDTFQPKKSPKGGKLKKERFQPIQKRYQPAKCTQMFAIQKDMNKTLNLEELDQKPINSWSREDKRRKSNEYVKQLKQELALISQTPRVNPLNTKITKQ